ncbi:hypothetical protein [Parafrankia sp. EUN1f]|uniref:hypothetical protein n=1 Tax=Parafrankia sp. EUN1f TaxID=102897 RepID=UPI0001C46B55|nr:hypothetical protein [Parafrankia sp. EUN1f]EFC86423.1 hypothetical protein FrEUN1fDRAFT_0524 [Parafrankia sp. EUN1f]
MDVDPASTEVPSVAVAEGGPLDGRRLGDAQAAEFEVVMADRSRHLYRATTSLARAAPAGELHRIFRWEGRVDRGGPPAQSGPAG